MGKLTTTILALTAAFALGACGDKKGGPPDDEGGEIAQKSSACDSSWSADAFADCAREVLATAGLLPEENDDLMGCKFDSAKPKGSPVDTFEAAKQAVKRTCE